MTFKFKLFGYFLAGVAVVVWAATFVATKYLLADFSALEIQYFRFLLAYVVLWGIYPRADKIAKGDEKLFFFLGLTGAALYQMLENCALYYSTASNVSIIVAAAPVMTAILGRFWLKMKLRPSFWPGLVLALVGIVLVSTKGNFSLAFHPLGDFLAVLCMLSWGFYSIVMDKLNAKGYNQFFQIRRSFFWALVMLLPLFLLSPLDGLQGLFGLSFDFSRFLQLKFLLPLTFLGVLASAISFTAWNKASQIIGTVKCAVGIYLCPVITMLLAWAMLGETPCLMSVLGTIMILVGVFITSL